MKTRSAILVLDDDEELLQMMSKTLSDTYDVFTASDVLAATTLLNTRRYDLFITDLQMPVLNGVEFIRMLRTHPQFSQMPILVVSAFPELAERLEGVKVSGTLQKPFSLPQLLAQISQIIQTPRDPSRAAPAPWA